MKMSSRTHQNQRVDPLFPRWQNGGTQAKTAKGIALSAVARTFDTALTCKVMIESSRAFDQIAKAAEDLNRGDNTLASKEN